MKIRKYQAVSTAGAVQRPVTIDSYFDIVLSPTIRRRQAAFTGEARERRQNTRFTPFGVTRAKACKNQRRMTRLQRRGALFLTKTADRYDIRLTLPITTAGCIAGGG